MTDFNRQLNDLENAGAKLAERATELAAHIARAQAKTAELLAIAAEYDVNVVGIGAPPAERTDWPFGYRGSIFTEREARDSRGWPAAWAIAARAGIAAGAGNTGQHQADLTDLVDGVYRRKNGQWFKEAE